MSRIAFFNLIFMLLIILTQTSHIAKSQFLAPLTNRLKELTFIHIIGNFLDKKDFSINLQNGNCRSPAEPHQYTGLYCDIQFQLASYPYENATLLKRQTFYNNEYHNTIIDGGTVFNKSDKDFKVLIIIRQEFLEIKINDKYFGLFFYDQTQPIHRTNHILITSAIVKNAEVREFLLVNEYEIENKNYMNLENIF
ncbi:uncharacterized protein LOC129610075 isoform X2 [Condylostylus longicornis]|uniref:uncharacterized protein LOC129610075 isoform X2 n=1 Tax=Condylostylus longicornis TaxID=2530218 RepID=UPI00244E53DE|nr:uncharacterized protein LOC129610075 isoform X2 [Condylostylus longicornis]